MRLAILFVLASTGTAAAEWIPRPTDDGVLLRVGVDAGERGDALVIDARVPEGTRWFLHNYDAISDGSTPRTEVVWFDDGHRTGDIASYTLPLSRLALSCQAAGRISFTLYSTDSIVMRRYPSASLAVDRGRVQLPEQLVGYRTEKSRPWLLCPGSSVHAMTNTQPAAIDVPRHDPDPDWTPLLLLAGLILAQATARLAEPQS